MSDFKTAPVLLYTFNRPEWAAMIVEQIRLAKPEKLYISSDAARIDHLDEQQLIIENRKIIGIIDWPCEVKTLFQETHLGKHAAFYEAIHWFFKHEPEGIILEEDCLPNPHFFHFCSSLLSHYMNDPRIMHISGANQQNGNKIGEADYYFSAFPAISGWASWRRVWNLNDLKMSSFPQIEKQQTLKNVFFDDDVVKELYRTLRTTFETNGRNWAHHLGLTIIANNGLCIVPNENLVNNLADKEIADALLKPFKSVGSLKHPHFFLPNRRADIIHLTWLYGDSKISLKTAAEKPKQTRLRGKSANLKMKTLMPNKLIKLLSRFKQAAKLILKGSIENRPVPEPNFGIKTGTGTNIGVPKRIEGKQYIQIGNNCHIGPQIWLGAYDSYPYSNQVFTPQITIADNVFIGDRVIITSVNKIIIEEGVEISHDVFISDHVHSNTPEENVPLTRRRLVSRGYVKIGAYTGVGIRSVISQGVTLGKYCFVTPNSVVTRSFPDYSMIRGNPAILIKTFSKEKNKWVDPDEAMTLKYNKSL